MTTVVAHPYFTGDQVAPNVFISGYLAAASSKFVYDRKITHIVKLFADDVTYHGGATRHPGVTYVVLPAEDRPDYDIRKDLTAAVKSIRANVRAGKTVLVHCHAGVSRSATAVLAWLMIDRGYTLDGALKHLKKVRPWVAPNSGFMALLQEIDAKIAVLRKARRAHGRARPRPAALRVAV